MADFSELYRMIGSMQSDVHSIKKQLDKAEDGRAKIHSRVDQINDDVSSLKNEIQGIGSDVEESKKVTDEVKRWKQMGFGAISVIGIGGAAFGAMVWSLLEPYLKHLKG